MAITKGNQTIGPSGQFSLTQICKEGNTNEDKTVHEYK